MSDQELKDLVASLAVAQKETSEQIKQVSLEIKQSNLEINQQFTERMEISRKEVDKQIKQTQKQLGELGNKWGTFTEGMAIESIKKILRDKFNIPVISRNVEKRMNGESGCRPHDLLQ